MRTKTIFLIVITTLFAVGFFSLQLFSYPGGAPAAKTGSPADAKTCMACHKATLKKQEGMITSDAENNMYEPGKTYTIQAAAKGSANTVRIGFEVSPQNAAGELLGTLILTNPDETKLIGKGKYITHTDQGSRAQGSKKWSFNWKAPAAGTGDVTFYGSFMVSESSQLVYTSTLTLKEKK
ncbi:MAG TPA: Reeler domain-containing protein [Bacteroidales bacterium]|jgi:hypothetical protein|nr:hypothetical protein [Bacteroidales bacterium]HNZ43269.1 Reeler domain-containing protein [Bacteroidales bacterium]HOH84194.1 Reeler domain-containing protein [Bacteroidales bacterium]HPB25917.1 Reeler domain-containing protein [Bacteroidales bacterium]HPI29833.1 Reeler domain-containing protein [Bacteroidales bacterium]